MLSAENFTQSAVCLRIVTFNLYKFLINIVFLNFIVFSPYILAIYVFIILITLGTDCSIVSQFKPRRLFSQNQIFSLSMFNKFTLYEKQENYLSLPSAFLSSLKPNASPFWRTPSILSSSCEEIKRFINRLSAKGLW